MTKWQLPRPSRWLRAIGLILPAARGNAPVLLPLAALGLVGIMLRAGITTHPTSRDQVHGGGPGLSRRGRFRGVGALGTRALHCLIADLAPLTSDVGDAARDHRACAHFASASWTMLPPTTVICAVIFFKSASGTVK